MYVLLFIKYLKTLEKTKGRKSDSPLDLGDWIIKDTSSVKTGRKYIPIVLRIIVFTN